MSDADLSHHYKVLKQFLDISDDSNSRAKSNSSRAARAREKLLRLSGAQFRELSTDVYDELRRRIDESRSEPDFLLPKSTFHPKRNQARQKLSSLPQSRFKDLVSDISFEIERRNLHSPVSTSVPPPESPSTARGLQDQQQQQQQQQQQYAPRRPSHSRSQSTDVHHTRDVAHAPAPPAPTQAPAPAATSTTSGPTAQVSQVSHASPASPPQKRNSLSTRDIGTAAKGTHNEARSSAFSASSEETGNVTSNVANSTSLQDDLATPNLKNQVSEKAIGLQPTTVVPTKATMTWSSDEDDEDAEDELHDARNSIHEEPRQLNFPNAFGGPSRSVNAPIDHSVNAPANRSVNAPMNRSVNSPVEQPQPPKAAPIAEKPSVSNEKHHELKSAYESLRQEHESLINAHEDAQTQLSELSRSHADAKSRLDDLQDSHQSAERDFGTLNEKHADVLSKHDDLEALVEKLTRENEELTSVQAKLPSVDEVQALRSEVEDLRTSNAALRLENSNLKTSSPKPKRAEPLSRGLQPSTAKTDAKETGSSDISAQLQKLHEKLDQIPNGAQSQFSEKEARLKSEISQWQTKYESLKAGYLNEAARNPGKSMDLAKFRSSDGLLSYNTAVEFFSAVDLFYAALDITKPDSDLLFDKISSIAVSANRIASQATKTGFNDNGYAGAVRESASHALTATRYFVIYPTLMPKVIVERAVSEIVFSVCDSISALKFSFVSENEQPGVEGKSGSSNSKDVISDEVNVKPLRITQKRAQLPASRFESGKTSDGTVTSQEQTKNPSQTASEASQFSPIQSRAKDQSSPTQNRDVQYPAQVPVTESKLSTEPKPQSKTDSNSKFEDETKITESNSAKKSELATREVNGNADPSATLENSKKVPDEIDAKSSSKSTTPSILDKVRKFERENSKPNANMIETPLASKGIENTSAPVEEVKKTPNATETSNNTSPSTENGPTRNKSIFQSLRERFTPTDGNAKSTKPSDFQAKVKGSAEDDDGEESFEEVVTPSKTKPHVNAASLKELGTRSGDLDFDRKLSDESQERAHVSTGRSEDSEASSSTESSKYATGADRSVNFPSRVAGFDHSNSPVSAQAKSNALNNVKSDSLGSSERTSERSIPSTSGKSISSRGENLSKVMGGDLVEPSNVDSKTPKSEIDAAQKNNLDIRDADKFSPSFNEKPVEATAEEPIKSSEKKSSIDKPSVPTIEKASGSSVSSFGKINESLGADSASNSNGRSSESEKEKSFPPSDDKSFESATEKFSASPSESSFGPNGERQISPSMTKSFVAGSQKPITSALNETLQSGSEKSIEPVKKSVASIIEKPVETIEKPTKPDETNSISSTTGKPVGSVTKSSKSEGETSIPSSIENPFGSISKSLETGAEAPIESVKKSGAFATGKPASSVGKLVKPEGEGSVPSFAEKPLGSISKSLKPEGDGSVPSFAEKPLGSISKALKPEGDGSVPSLAEKPLGSISKSLKPEGDGSVPSFAEKPLGSISKALKPEGDGSAPSFAEKPLGSISKVLKPEGDGSVPSFAEKPLGSISKSLKPEGDGSVPSFAEKPLGSISKALKPEGDGSAPSFAEKPLGSISKVLKPEGDGSVPSFAEKPLGSISKALKPEGDGSAPSFVEKPLGSISKSLKPEGDGSVPSFAEKPLGSISKSLKPEGDGSVPSFAEKPLGSISKALKPEGDGSAPSFAEKPLGSISKVLKPEGDGSAPSFAEKPLGSISKALKPEGDGSVPSFAEKPLGSISNSLKSGTENPIESAKKSFSVGSISKSLKPEGQKNVASPFEKPVDSVDEFSKSLSDKPVVSKIQNAFTQSSNKTSSTGTDEISTSPEEDAVVPDRRKPFEATTKRLFSGEKSLTSDEGPVNGNFKPGSENPNTSILKKSVASTADKINAPNQPETEHADSRSLPQGKLSPESEKVFLIPNEKRAAGEAGKKPLADDQKDTPYAKVGSTQRGDATENNFSKLGESRDISASKSPMGLKMKSPSFKVRKVNYEDAVEEQADSQGYEDADDDSYDEEEDEIRQRQDYRKSMAAATFNFDLFDIDDPDNTVTQVLLYLEHQTVQVISTIQDLLSAIKKPDATRGELRHNSAAISEVIRQMTEATNTSMNQTRNYQLREHGSWVVKSLEDCNHRMNALCKPNKEKTDSEFADRHFKQRLAGISFDIAKCTKELVKTVEEASLKEDIAHLDARLNHPDDLT